MRRGGLGEACSPVSTWEWMSSSSSMSGYTLPTSSFFLGTTADRKKPSGLRSLSRSSSCMNASKVSPWSRKRWSG